jgi:acetyl esterase/lipase
MADLRFLQPFVAPYEPVEPIAVAGLEVYRPEKRPAPAVVLVHGGPVPAALPQRPPSWPTFRGYGSLLAAAGVTGVMFEHGYRTPRDLDRAAEDVRRAVAEARAAAAVDPERVVLWFFSGGATLAGPWLAEPPPWLAAVVLTYPQLDHWPGVGSGPTTPVSVAAAVRTPVLLVRVEHELDLLVPAQEDFVAACPAVSVLDVPGAHHGFETIDDTPGARVAIADSVAWAADRARRGAPGPGRPLV